MTRDDDGNLLTTEYGLCEYTDSQGIHLQVRRLMKHYAHATLWLRSACAHTL